MEKREFKVGDKVKIPKTKSEGISINDSAIKTLFSEEKHDYLIVKWITNLFPNFSEKIVECMFPTSKLCTQFLNIDLEHYEEEFVLPKCWFVLYNSQEEFDIINKFYGKDWVYCNYENKCGYHNNGDNQIDTNNWVGTIGSSSGREKLLKNGYIQITFQQFQKYVLKEKEMEKKIIGYKLNGKVTAKEAAEFLECSKNLNENGCFFWKSHFDSTSFFKAKRTGVLDLWFEPVYKQEKQIIQMYSSNNGMFEIEVVDGKAYYRPENKELPKKWIKDIINSYDDILIQQRNGVNPYNVKIAGLHVGCYQNCKKQDWENVYKLLK